jgi:Na+/H+-translocating membrane pyrophosphatase
MHACMHVTHNASTYKQMYANTYASSRAHTHTHIHTYTHTHIHTYTHTHIHTHRFRAVIPAQEAAGLTRFTLATLTTVSFLFGALCSAAAGYTGMWVSVRANVRVAGAARRSAREALMVALRAGGFASLIVVGMAVLGVSVLFAMFYVYFQVLRFCASMNVCTCFKCTCALCWLGIN